VRRHPIEGMKMRIDLTKREIEYIKLALKNNSKNNPDFCLLSAMVTGDILTKIDAYCAAENL